MQEEYKTISAENLTDDEIFKLLSPEDKAALNLGRKVKKRYIRNKYIKYGVILIVTALAIAAIYLSVK